MTLAYRERLASVRRIAQRRTKNLYDTYFTRRVSAYITALLLPRRVSPNLVSALNLGVGAGLCALIATGDRRFVLAGALALHLYAVLDSVDGELARALGRSSLRGMFLESWSAYLMINGFSLAVGAYLWKAGVGFFPFGLALVVAVFGRNAAPVARRVAIEVAEKAILEDPFPRQIPPYEQSPRQAPDQVAASEPKKSVRRFVEESLLYQTNVWLVLSLLLSLESVFPSQATRLVLPAFLFYTVGALLKEAGIVWLVLATPFLQEQVSRLAHHGTAGAMKGKPTKP